MSSSAPVDGRVDDVYDWSPKMSTYLLAFIVSKYDNLTNGDVNKPFGVFARPEAVNYTKDALDFGVAMLNKFNDYLELDYYSVQNITKMDMAAIPDFSAGGEFKMTLTYILNY